MFHMMLKVSINQYLILIIIYKEALMRNHRQNMFIIKVIDHAHNRQVKEMVNSMEAAKNTTAVTGGTLKAI